MNPAGCSYKIDVYLLSSVWTQKQTLLAHGEHYWKKKMGDSKDRKQLSKGSEDLNVGLEHLKKKSSTKRHFSGLSQ